jgi:hypothetical protein
MLLLSMLLAALPLLLDMLYFRTSGLLSLYGFPIIIGAIIGFIAGKRDWKRKKIVPAVIFVVLLFCLFPFAFLMDSQALHTLKVGTTPPPGFTEIKSDLPDIYAISDVKGKIAYHNGFWVILDGKVIYDGQDVGPQYSDIEDWAIINDTIVLKVHKYLDGDYLVYDNKIYALDNSTIPKDEYDSAFNLSKKFRPSVSLGNKTCTLTDKESPSRAIPLTAYIDCGGDEYGKQYYSIGDFAAINGKLAYVAITRSGLGYEFLDRFIVYDGKEIGKEYYYLQLPFEFNGKLGFVGYKNENDMKNAHPVIVIEE